MTKKLDKPKLVLHFKSGNYIYRYVLVDRFKNDNKYHYGFDTKEEFMFQRLHYPNYHHLNTWDNLRKKIVTI